MSRMCDPLHLVPKLRLGMHVPEALLRELDTCKGHKAEL